MNLPIFGVILLIYANIFTVNGRILENEEVDYLKRYGYLPDDEGLELAYKDNWPTLKDAIKLLQTFAHLPSTGILDSKTKQVFKRPRCGVRDVHKQGGFRKKRFVINNPWESKRITYRIKNVSRHLAQADIERVIAEAFDKWAVHGNLDFIKVSDRDANINISFEIGDHGDNFAFEGLGSILAHAFAPPMGSVHFDDDELWTLENNIDPNTTNFIPVALHEIGHALGMEHSAAEGSIMNPFYTTDKDKGDSLSMDDIIAMHKLYLNNEEKVQKSSNENSDIEGVAESDSGDYDDTSFLCMANYDTIQVLQGKIFVFEEDMVWMLRSRNVIENGFPLKFQDIFIGLPKRVNSIKAIYENRRGNIVVFSGKHYWEFDTEMKLYNRGQLQDFGLPKKMKSINAVFLSNYNNKTYFFQDERFWRYDEDLSRMDPGYPKNMAAWRNIPSGIGAALVWEGDTFFFKGPRFWRFDNTLITAVANYPQPTAAVWLSCEFTPDMLEFTRPEPYNYQRKPAGWI